MVTAISNPELETAVKKIVEEYQPEKIILFGSRVRGEERPDSDYDFIIIKETKTSWASRALEIPNVPFQADFFVYTPEEFERMKTTSVFMYHALKNHKVLYDKNKK